MRTEGLGHRFWTWSVLGLCLPAVCVVFLVAAFLFWLVPDIVHGEAQRVRDEYRKKALEIKEHPEQALAYERGKGEVMVGKMAPGTWGFVPREDGSVWVWYETKQGCWGKQIAQIREIDFWTLCAGGSILVVSLFLLLTFFAVRFFLVYARERDDFVAATAHDLTTPLVALRMSIGRDDAAAKILVERMIRLVRNLTDFLRLGGQRPAPAREVFDIVRTYEEAYQLFRDDYRDLFEGADVAVTRETSDVRVCADEAMTLQILWNLLGNDLKYAAPYGRVSVRFCRPDAQGRVAVEFADEGKGLDARVRKHIFERYYRARSAQTSGKGGFGLGLSTAREFARAMGGDLTVRPNKPHGCVFTLTLPRSHPNR